MKNILLRPVNNSSPIILILLILLIALVGFVSMDIYFPSLPAISEFFKVKQGTAQLTLTLFLLGFGFSQIIYGSLSDYYGRRPILLIGFFIYLAGSIILLSAQGISMLLFARFIQGAGAGAGASLCRVLLRDNFIGNKMAQVTSYLTIGVAFATALAPALGGLIQEKFGFYGNFYFMFLFGGIVTLLVLLYLPETNKTVGKYSLHPSAILKSYYGLFKNKVFVGNMLCAGLALSALLAYAIINPFLLQNNLGLSPANYGLITLFIASGELAGTYINGLFVMRAGYKVMMYIGIGLMVFAGTVSLCLSAFGIFTIASVATSTFLLTMSTGITIPNASAGAFSELTHSIGTAGAIYGFFQIVVTIITTYYIASLAHQSQSDLGFIFLSLGIISTIIYSWIAFKKSS